MDLIKLLSMVPVSVLILVSLLLAIITAVMIFQYVKLKKLDGIREKAYNLILRAEHLYNVSGTGKIKLKWVVSQVREILPLWLRMIISEKELIEIVETWFQGVKDLLDDGKINASIK